MIKIMKVLINESIDTHLIYIHINFYVINIYNINLKNINLHRIHLFFCFFSALIFQFFFDLKI